MSDLYYGVPLPTRIDPDSTITINLPVRSIQEQIRLALKDSEQKILSFIPCCSKFRVCTLVVTLLPLFPYINCFCLLARVLAEGLSCGLGDRC